MANKTHFPKRALCALLAIIMLFGASFAYFSDYATSQANGTAGTVALSMDSNINLLDAEGRDILNPGDMRDGSFEVTNEGNKSVDVRTTIVLTAQDYAGNPVTFTGDATTQSEYDLYLREDVEYVEGRGYMPKEGAQPLQVKSIDQDTITYILPEYSLNGNSDNYDEVETVDGVNEFTHVNDFVFVFKGESGNEWQDSSVQLDVLVEAKQHENTQAGWDIVAKETITSGAINQEVVKGENVITAPDGQAQGTITFSLRDGNLNGIENVTMKLVKLPEGTVSTVDTLGGTVIKTVRSDENGEGIFAGLELGNYALVSPNFILTAEAENLAILSNNDTDHYEYIGDLDWASSVDGTIVDTAGNPVVNQDVSLKDENNEFVASGKTDENGNFTIYPAIDGDYTLDLGPDAIPDVNASINSGNVTLGEIKVARYVLIQGTEFNAIIPDDVNIIRFVSTPIPEGVETINVGGADIAGNFVNGDIYAYQEGNELIVTTGNGRMMYANTWSSEMFKDKTQLTEIVFDNFNAQNIWEGGDMFNNCDGLTELDLTNWGTVASDFNCVSIFSGCDNLKQVTLPIANKLADVQSMFAGCAKLETVEGSNFNIGNCTSPSNIPSTGIFANCSSLKNVNIAFDTTNAPMYLNIGYMFVNCTSLETLDISNWNLVNVRNMQQMFEGCTSLKNITGIENADVSNVTNMSSMFKGCTSLESLDLNNWYDNATSVTKTSYMFEGCTSLTNLKMNNNIFPNVEHTNGMFKDCSALTFLSLSNWNAKSIIGASSMFEGCVALKTLNLNAWQPINLQSASKMFYGCSALTTINTDWPDAWAENAVITYSDLMFYGCTSIKSCCGVTYDASKTDWSMACHGTGYLTDTLCF